MCGITGIFSFKGHASMEMLHKMTNKISHRGPNAYGYYESEGGMCALGHRRLSISFN